MDLICVTESRIPSERHTIQRRRHDLHERLQASPRFLTGARPGSAPLRAELWSRARRVLLGRACVCRADRGAKGGQGGVSRARRQARSRRVARMLPTYPLDHPTHADQLLSGQGGVGRAPRASCAGDSARRPSSLTGREQRSQSPRTRPGRSPRRTPPGMRPPRCRGW
jgi:hypothetical protein